MILCLLLGACCNEIHTEASGSVAASEIVHATVGHSKLARGQRAELSMQTFSGCQRGFKWTLDSRGLGACVRALRA